MTNETAVGRWQVLHHVLDTHPPLAVLIVQFAALPFLSFGAASLSIMAAAAAFALWSAERTSPYDSETLIAGTLTPVGLLVSGLALWIVISLVPLGLVGGGHPLWGSIEEALGAGQVAHTLTIDKAASLRVLAWTIVAATFGLAIVLASLERHAAALLTSGLTLVGTGWAIGALTATFTAGVEPGSALSVTGAGGMAGVYAALMLGLRLADLAATSGRAAIKDWRVLALLAAFTGSAGAASFLPGGLVALSAGVAVLIACALLRGQTGFMERVIALCIVVAVTAGTALAAGDGADASVLTRLVTGRIAAPEAQQVIADAPLLGFGAGALDGVRRIYLAPGDVWLPSALTRSALELGVPVTLALLAALIGLALLFAKSAALRLRDWSYPATGAASLFAACIAGLYSAAPSALESLLFLTALTGLAIGQAKGRGGERQP